MRVAAYESLLDLFTLVSLMLMFAAFIHTAHTGAADRNWGAITPQIARRGSGSPRSLPENALLLAVYRQGSVDYLGMSQESGVGSTNLVVTPANIQAVLSGILSQLIAKREISVAVYDGEEKANPAVALALQHWLADHQCRRYRFYFADK